MNTKFAFTPKSPMHNLIMKIGMKLSDAAMGARQVIIALIMKEYPIKLRPPNFSAKTPPNKFGIKLPQLWAPRIKD